MIILFLLAFAAGLTVGLLWSLVARQDWREEVRRLDTSNEFWRAESLELVRYNALLAHRIRELEQDGRAVDNLPIGIDAERGFVWFGS